MSPPPLKRRRALSTATNGGADVESHRAAVHAHPPPPYHTHPYDHRPLYDRSMYTVGPGQAPTAHHHPPPPTAVLAPSSSSDRTVGNSTRGDAHGAPPLAGGSAVASGSFSHPSHPHPHSHPHPQHHLHSHSPVSTTTGSYFQWEPQLPPGPGGSTQGSEAREAQHQQAQQQLQIQQQRDEQRRWQLAQAQAQQQAAAAAAAYPAPTRSHSHSFTSPTLGSAASTAQTQTPYRYPPLTQAQEDLVQPPPLPSAPSPISHHHHQHRRNSTLSPVQGIGKRRSRSFTSGDSNYNGEEHRGAVQESAGKHPRLELEPRARSPLQTHPLFSPPEASGLPLPLTATSPSTLTSTLTSTTTTTAARRPSFTTSQTETTRRVSISRTSPPHFRRDSVTATTSSPAVPTPTSTTTMSTNGGGAGGGRYATSSPVASTSHHPHPHTHSHTHTTTTNTNSTTNNTTHGPGIGSPLPPLSLSILGVEPLDEFIKDIADFVHHLINTRPEALGGVVEVEAKIGLLKQRGGGGDQRLRLPVRVESILAPGEIDVRFESNMRSEQHKHYNTLLNSLKTNPPSTATSPMEYYHLHLVDDFYSDVHQQDPVLKEALASLAHSGVQGAGRGAEKIRVTRDEKTGKIIQCVRKIRLGDLNVYSPQRNADWRVSVNLEVPVSQPSGQPLYTRRKDRLRYEHEEFIIDLTQVTTSGSNSSTLTMREPLRYLRPQSKSTKRNGTFADPLLQPEKLHELELEIARPELLLTTAAKRNDVSPSVSDHERSAFDELIRAFVNNARILTKNAMGEGW